MGEAVLLRPGGGVGVPVDGEGGLGVVECGENEGGAAEMVRGANDFGGGPVVLVHELGRVVDVLDGVEGLGLFEDGVSWDALCLRELGHSVGLDEVVVGWAAGHDDMGGDAGFVLSDAFEDTLALLG